MEAKRSRGRCESTATRPRTVWPTPAERQARQGGDAAVGQARGARICSSRRTRERLTACAVRWSFAFTLPTVWRALAGFSLAAETMLRLIRTSVILLFAVMTIALVVMALSLRDQFGPWDVEAAALKWAGDGEAQKPRREGGRWEVDVVRADGSMVQVSVGDDLELLGLDEELGPAGTLAPDELRGTARARAVRTAFAETRPGQVTSVERDSSGQIEVCIRMRAGRQVEVELDHMLRVVEVESDDPCDG